MEPEPLSTPPPEPATRLPPAQTNWLLLAGLLLAPAGLALLAAVAKVGGTITVCIPVVGGTIAGIAWGTVLGRRIGKTLGGKILLGVVIGAAFACVSFGLGYGGCMMGGFNIMKAR